MSIHNFISIILFTFLVAITGYNNHVYGQGEAFIFSFFQDNGQDGLHLAYSYDGYNWKALKKNKSFLKPEVGEDKLMRDPCLIKGGDGKFHMVWTVSWKEKSIGYASSDDLIHGSEQKAIPVMAHEEEARNGWAPEIYFDTNSELYLIYWSTTIPGRFPETDSKGDDGYNHRMYYVTTRDFTSFSKTKLFYDHGFNVIDGAIIYDSDSYYLFLKDETRNPPQKNIRIAISTDLSQNYGKPSNPITGDYWAEGPTVTRISDEWIVYFDKYRKNKMGAVVSTDLVNWRDFSDKINFPKGTRHGTVLKVPKEFLDQLIKNLN